VEWLWLVVVDVVGAVGIVGIGTCVIGTTNIVVICIVSNGGMSHVQASREEARLLLKLASGECHCKIVGSGVAIVIGVIVIGCCMIVAAAGL